jgi:site-specific DNA-methyltransferase (adenine-specific)
VQKNQLYYGDNLTVLREYINDESVDLIYLDPPFNSRQDYNVLFAERDGTRSASQIMAFEDTWEWNMDAERAYEEIVERGGRVSDAMRAFRTFLGHSDMMAYLAMMAPRLIELRRVLKETGSIYLHCDPTASHYLKMLMDAVFGTMAFRNEIIWKRTSGHNDAVRQFGAVTDTILFYAKSNDYPFNVQYVPYSQSYIETFYVHSDPDGRRWRRSDLRSPHPRPNLVYDYKGWKPHPNGWAVSREVMERLDREGRLHFPKKATGRIQLKRYLDEMPGQPCTNSWDDIPPIHALTAERLGYPTQKPEALLERIIKASSNEGDLVLDPFCGCGTAIAAAQKLNRRWIGIDITHLAIGLIKKRLDDAFGEDVRKTYEVVGEPVDLAGAQKLAADDPYQFQWWALSLVGARPLEKKKGADRGIDGRLYFHDEHGGKTKQIILSVKAGNVQAAYVRDLRGVIEREKAEIGALISMEPPTKPMLKEAAEAGFYALPGFADRYPRIQILSIAELLVGKKIEYPRLLDLTYKKGPRARGAVAETQIPLVGAEVEDEGPF